MPRQILSRTYESDFLTLHGLQTLSGCVPQELDQFIVKELADNALDAADEQHSGNHPSVQVWSSVKDGVLELKVSDNAFGIDNEAIRKIADLTRKYSSRFNYKYPTRGSMGHAWKLILGATYALWNNAGRKNEPEAPITIYNHKSNTQYALRLEYDEEAKVVLEKKKVPNVSIEETTGTTVTVKLPIFNPEWAKDDRHHLTVFQFALFNPHVLFTYNGKRFSSLTEKDIHAKIRESAHWFSFEEFHQRVKATAKDYPETTLGQFVSGFRGFSGFHQQKALLDRLGGDRALSSIAASLDETNGLFTAMRQLSETPSASVLPKIGADNFRQRLRLGGFLTEKTARWFRYKCKRGTLTRRNINMPIQVEVAVGVHEKSGCYIFSGINYSPRFEDPFLTNVFEFPNDDQIRIGIKGILDKNGIASKDPVIVVVHIACPNPQYEDPAKSLLDVGPFHYAVQDAVDSATRFYKRLKPKLNAILEGAPVPTDQKEAVFNIMPKAIDFVSSRGKYVYKVRNLWYVIRAMFDQLGWSAYLPTYEYFNPKMTTRYQRKYGDLPNMVKEASAWLTEPRSKLLLPLSTMGEREYQIPKYKYNKLLFVEKRGFSDLITGNRLHDKFDLAIIGGRGQSPFAARRLLKRVKQFVDEEGLDIKILSLHDADLWGFDIQHTLGHPTETLLDHKVEGIIDLGLTFQQAEELGLRPEKVKFKRKRDIPQKLRDTLPRDELEKLKLWRVELDAMTPEQFCHWLEQQLEKHGIKEKVRPLDDVVHRETQETIATTLDDGIKDTILQLCGGKDFIAKLKDHLIKEHNLDGLNLTQDIDDELAHYPVEGWQDIINERVNDEVHNILVDEKVKNLLCKTAIEALNNPSFSDGGVQHG